MKKTLLLLALALPLNGSDFLFGMVPFRSHLSDFARRAVACIGSVCAARASAELPTDLKDAPASLPAGHTGVAAIGIIPGRAFLILPPPKQQ